MILQKRIFISVLLSAIIILLSSYSCRTSERDNVCDNLEVSASTYAWELHDEGITHLLDDMQAYLIAIYTDLARNYDLDYVQTCMVNFASGEIENGGFYDLRISYADEKEGNGKVSLFVNTKEIDSWLPDQDFDCWKIRTIRHIFFKKVDAIKIESNADGNDWAV